MATYRKIAIAGDTDEKVTEVLLKAKFLSLQSIYLASAVIGEPLWDFRCYRLRMTAGVHLPY